MSNIPGSCDGIPSQSFFLAFLEKGLPTFKTASFWSKKSIKYGGECRKKIQLKILKKLRMFNLEQRRRDICPQTYGGLSQQSRNRCYHQKVAEELIGRKFRGETTPKSQWKHYKRNSKLGCRLEVSGLPVKIAGVGLDKIFRRNCIFINQHPYF